MPWRSEFGRVPREWEMPVNGSSELTLNQGDLQIAGDRNKTMPTKYCKLCTDETPCGKDQVYVIELDVRVAKAGVFLVSIHQGGG